MFSTIPQPIGCGPVCCTTSSTPVASLEEVINVDSIADLAALAGYPGLKVVNVDHYLVENDGGGGIWPYYPASTAVDDGYFVVASGNGLGNFIKLV